MESLGLPHSLRCSLTLILSLEPSSACCAVNAELLLLLYRYSLFLPLHELWKQYIRDLCNGLKPDT